MSHRFMTMDRIRNVRLPDRLPGTEGLGSSQDGILDGRIPCTTAERILQCKTNLVLGRIWIALKQRIGRQDLAGNTEATLHCSMFDKRFLKRVEFHLLVHALGKPFDRNDGFPTGALRRIDAGDHRLPIDQDRTRATLGLFTTDLCSGKLQPLAQKCG